MNLEDFRYLAEESERGENIRESIYSLINESPSELFRALFSIINEFQNFDSPILTNSLIIARSLLPKTLSFPFIPERDPIIKLEQDENIITRFFEAIFQIMTSEQIEISIRNQAEATFSKYFVFFEAFKQINPFWTPLYDVLENSKFSTSSELVLSIIIDILEELTISNEVNHKLYAITFEYFMTASNASILRQVIRILRSFVINFDNLAGDNIGVIYQRMAELTQISDYQEECCDFWKEVLKSQTQIFPLDFIFPLIQLINTSEHKTSILSLMCNIVVESEELIQQFLQENMQNLMQIFINLLDSFADLQYIDEDENTELYLIKIIIEMLLTLDESYSAMIYENIDENLTRKSFILIYALASAESEYGTLVDDRFSDILMQSVVEGNVEISRLSLSIIKTSPKLISSPKPELFSKIIEFILYGDEWLFEISTKCMVALISQFGQELIPHLIECLLENLNITNIVQSSHCIEAIAHILEVTRDAQIFVNLSEVYPSILSNFSNTDLGSDVFVSIYLLSIEFLMKLRNDFEHLELMDQLFKGMLDSNNSAYGIYGILNLIQLSQYYSQEQILEIAQALIPRFESQNLQDIESCLSLYEKIVEIIPIVDLDKKLLEICLNILRSDALVKPTCSSLFKLILSIVEQERIDAEYVNLVCETTNVIAGEIINIWNDDEDSAQRLIFTLCDLVAYIKMKLNLDVSGIASMIYTQVMQINEPDESILQKITMFGSVFELC